MSIFRSIKSEGERAARRQLMEELFYDFHRDKFQIFFLNFIRGIFFGFGTVLGGTVLVALVVWILGQFFGWFPYIHQVIEAIQR